VGGRGGCVGATRIPGGNDNKRGSGLDWIPYFYFRKLGQLVRHSFWEGIGSVGGGVVGFAQGGGLDRFWGGAGAARHMQDRDRAATYRHQVRRGEYPVYGPWLSVNGIRGVTILMGLRIPLYRS
jgi:hypothetical protein